MKGLSIKFYIWHTLLIIISFALIYLLTSYYVIDYNFLMKVDSNDILNKINSFSFPLIWGFLALYLSLVWYILSFNKLLKRLYESRNSKFIEIMEKIKGYFFITVFLSVSTSLVYFISLFSFKIPLKILLILSMYQFSLNIIYIIVIVHLVFSFFFILFKKHLSDL